MSTDGAKTHGSKFSSALETAVRICFVLLLSVHVSSVVSCCILRLCDVELAKT